MEMPSQTIERYVKPICLAFSLSAMASCTVPVPRSAICSQTNAAAMVREGWLNYVKPQYYTAEGRIAIQA
jgi:hypothetical protein